ncbi:MAG: SGNH/GDSL hydrolase family protein, partial [Oscillibacter sp.]|nr:SGNH/GDSL hydrolase family protein [Oscillibacter sp.]
GIHSYIRGSAEQYIWQSYYLLEDALRYHTPQVVVFNAQSLQFSVSQSEPYNRMSLEGMRWSPTKVRAILDSMRPEEHFVDYVFPILRYHARWSELQSTDFEYLFKTKPVTFNGYYMRVDVRPAENIPEARPLANYDFGDYAWKYLYKMDELCREKGITLILTKAPSLWPYWYDQYDQQVADFAAEHGLRYLNFLQLQEETGIDYATDTYDAGLHMNLSGAEKLSRYIGRILSEEEKVPDRRGNARLDAVWEAETAAYEAEKDAQYVKYGIDPA